MDPQPPFDLQPTLVGETIRLRPLAPEDFDALFAVAADPLIWEQHPEPTRYQRDVFAQFFAGAIASKGALVVIDKASGRPVGSSRYYDWKPDRRRIAIGYTFLVRSHWGGRTNAELKRLMLDHAFRWANMVVFHVGAQNLRSRKAMAKIGAQLANTATEDLGAVPAGHVVYRMDAAHHSDVTR